MGCSFEAGASGDIAEPSYSDVVTRILDGGPLSTVFQPIVNLFDGSVMGYEALARPEGFAVMDSVEAVFEAARNTEQIRNLDWVCRRRAVEDAKHLPARDREHGRRNRSERSGRHISTLAADCRRSGTHGVQRGGLMGHGSDSSSSGPPPSRRE
jgi:hypothetical protein